MNTARHAQSRSSQAGSDSQAAELRSEPRRATTYSLPAQLRIGRGRLSFAGIFRDFSAQGARLETPVALAVGSTVDLVMVKSGVRFEVRWRRPSQSRSGAYVYGLSCAGDDLTKVFSRFG
jgi:hypothetical protein